MFFDIHFFCLLRRTPPFLVGSETGFGLAQLQLPLKPYGLQIPFCEFVKFSLQTPFPEIKVRQVNSGDSFGISGFQKSNKKKKRPS